MRDLLVPVRRRRTLRRARRTTCSAVRTRGFRDAGGELLDLSHQGARLACGDVSMWPGDEVVLSFSSPRGDLVIDALAEVRRVDRGAAGVTAGLRFTELSWEARAALFCQLVRVPPPVPAARSQIDYAATVRRIARR